MAEPKQADDWITPGAPAPAAGGGGADDWAAPGAPRRAAPPPKAAPESTGGYGRNFRAGLTEFFTGMPQQLAAIGNADDPFLRANDPISEETKEAGRNAMTRGINAGLGAYNPEKVTTNGIGETASRFAGMGLGAALIPGAGEESLLGRGADMTGTVISRAANAPLKTFGRKVLTNVAASGAGGAAASQVPDDMPVTKLVTAAATAILGGSATEIPGMVKGLAGATKRAVAPLSIAGRDQMAADTLRLRSSNPSALLDSLDQPGHELVPNSQPTTGQLAGDKGILALEREQATKDPAAFNARREAQNSARRAALTNIQHEGDPEAVSSFLKGHFQQVDDQAQQHLDALTAKAQGATDHLGGTGTPDQHGLGIRDALQEGENTARGNERRLWKAVDPDNSVRINATPTFEAAADIQKSMSRMAAPMQGDEKGIFDAIQGEKNLSLGELGDLRSRVSSAMRAELMSNGRSPAYARLTQLRGAIQNNLADAAAGKVAEQAEAVAKGEMAAGDTVAGKMRGFLHDEQEQRVAQSGGAGGAGNAGRAGSGPQNEGGAGGTAFSAEGGPGNAAGGEGLPEGDGLVGAGGRRPQHDPELVAQAHADLHDYDANTPKDGSLLDAIKKAGGIRTVGPLGKTSREGSEVLAVLKDAPRGGLINNKTGATPDAMRAWLQEEGWFGRHPDQFGPNAMETGSYPGDDIGDFYDMLRSEASGKRVFHPESDSAAAAARRGSLDHEMSLAGVSAADSRPIAAQKLARFRAQYLKPQPLDAEELRGKAQKLGIELSGEETVPDLLDAISRAQHSTPEALTGVEHDIDRYLAQASPEAYGNLKQGEAHVPGWEDGAQHQASENLGGPGGHEAKPGSEAGGGNAAPRGAGPASAEAGKGSVEKPLTEAQFHRNYVQHIDLAGRKGDPIATRDSIMANGFEPKANVNALPPYRGGEPQNVVDQKFQPKNGDMVYLAPKGAWKDAPNGPEIQKGWKPKPYEAIHVQDDEPRSMYDRYVEAHKKHTEQSGATAGDAVAKDNLDTNFVPEAAPEAAEPRPLNSADADRLAEATKATKERAGTFGKGPVKDVLAKAGQQDLYKLPEAKVPDKFFHSGPTSAGDIRNLRKVIGPERADALLSDFAAASLRKAAENPDGTIDPGKAAAWRAKHSGALTEFPELADKLSNASSATVEIARAAKAQKQALVDRNATALGRVMKEDSAGDVTKAIGSMLTGQGGQRKMADLARAVSADPEAKAGLRQAVADHIATNMVSNTEAGTSGENLIKADAFQSFLKKNRGALAQVFEPEEMKTLDAISADLNRANRSIVAAKLPGQSNTAQDVLGVIRNDPQASVFTKLLAEFGAGGAGFAVGHMPGAMLAYGGTKIFNAMHGAGLQKVDQLVTEALLDPVLAKNLLRRAPARGAPSSGQPIAARLRRLGLATAAALYNSQSAPSPRE